jgi:hypothetical protein
MLLIWFRQNKLAYKIVAAIIPRIGEHKVSSVKALKKLKSMASVKRIMSMTS